MNPASEFEPSDTGLHGLEVAITGRLASMSRAEAIDAIRNRGGRYVETPRPETRLLVIGIDGPPLGKDGRPTRSLELAATLQRNGHSLEIIDEDTFLGRIVSRRSDTSRLYTIAQLARILDIATGEIRRWIRADLIQPKKIVKRLCYFDFAQVASARRLQQLSQSGITPARIRKSLEQVAEWLPDQGPSLALTQLEGIERGTLLVRLEDGRLAEPNGQLRLDFDASSADTPAAEPPCRQLRPREHTADDWFHIGVQAEENGEHESAAEAYEQALRLEPQPEIAFNLGNTYYATGRNVEAASCFIRATELDPEYVEAWNNLGNALAEIGRHDQAIAAYKEALRIEPHYADAHYNLGETLAVMQDHHGAARHWFAYLKQDPNSPWAQRVRMRLAELRGTQPT